MNLFGFHFHWFHIVFDTGINLYEECKCGRRKVTRYNLKMYQPIDLKWLNYEDEKVCR